MSYTKDFTATQADWLLVSNTGPGAFLQLKDKGPVLVQVAQASPGSSSPEGVEINDPGLMELTVDGMEVGDGVYIRSIHDENNVVCVVSPGTAPV